MPRAVATDAQRGLFLFLHYNLALHPVGFFLQQPHKMSELTPDGRNLRVRPSWTTSRLARAPKGLGSRRAAQLLRCSVALAKAAYRHARL